jgi:hypothetical protein
MFEEAEPRAENWEYNSIQYPVFGIQEKGRYTLATPQPNRAKAGDS